MWPLNIIKWLNRKAEDKKSSCNKCKGTLKYMIKVYDEDNIQKWKYFPCDACVY